MNTLPSSFLFPITILKIISCDQNNVPRKRGRERLRLKKLGLLCAYKMQLLWTTHQNCMITFWCIKFLMQGGDNRFNFQKLLSKNFNFLGCKFSFWLRPKVAIKPNRLEQMIFLSVFGEKRKMSCWTWTQVHWICSLMLNHPCQLSKVWRDEKTISNR